MIAPLELECSMSCFPKIDQPCPLGVDAQKRIAGYCGQCRKTVHALDALDASARLALVQQANAPICVSYRVPARIGAALMLTMAGMAFASDELSALQPLEVVQSSAVTPKDEEEPEVMMLGGVSDPQAVEWIETDEQSELPELPIIEE